MYLCGEVPRVSWNEGRLKMFPAPSAVCLMNVKIWRIFDEVGGGFLKTIRSVVNVEINARIFAHTFGIRTKI